MTIISKSRVQFRFEGKLMRTTKKKGDDFEREVEQLLKLKGFKIDRNNLLNGTQVDLIARKTDLLTNITLAVECTDREVPLGVDVVKEKAALLLTLPDSGVIYRLAIVTRKGYTAEAKAFAASNARLLLLTLGELEAHLVDFAPYIEWYISSFSESTGQFREGRLVANYVELSAQAEDGAFVPSVTDVVRDWLRDEDNNLLFLLGEFGSGKTSFVRHFVYNELQKHQRGDDSIAIPILFNLREYRSATSLPQLITDTLVNRYGVELTSFVAFERMCSARRVVVILDGFDEMTDKADRKTVIEAFNQIYLLAALDAKVILTCRSNYFRSNADITDLLRHFSISIPATESTEQLDISFEHQGKAITIAKLDSRQIRRFVEKRFGDDAEAVMQKIHAIHDLSDLSTRPVLLDMILTTLPELGEKKKRINSAALYEHYTDRWTRRDDWRLTIPLKVRQEFSDSLAWAMHSASLQEISSDMLQQVMVSSLADVAQSDVQMDYFQNDLQTCSFLVRAADGSDFRFAHRSFLEFFVARKIVDTLAQGKSPEGDFQAPKRKPIDVLDDLPILVERSDYLRTDFERVWLHLSSMLGKRVGYFQGVNAHVIGRDPRSVSARSWRGVFDERIQLCFRDLGIDTVGARLDLSEEIATFAVEYLQNSELTLGRFVASLADDLAKATLADLLRLSRSSDLTRENSGFIREYVRGAGHEGLKASLAADLTRSGYGLDDQYLRLISQSLAPRSWSYVLFIAAIASNVEVARLCLGWDSLRAIDRVICELSLRRAGSLSDKTGFEMALAAELVSGADDGEQMLALNACQALCPTDSEILTSIACAVAGSASERVQNEAATVLSMLGGDEAWRKLRARAAQETNPTARRVLLRAEQRLRDASSAEKNRSSWTESKRDRAARERIWKLL